MALFILGVDEDAALHRYSLIALTSSHEVN